MAITVSSKVGGTAELNAVLANLEPKVFRKGARKGVGDGTKIVLASARSKVKERTGSLRKALGRKVAAMKSGSGYYGVVGARRDSKKKINQSLKDFQSGKRKKALTWRFRRTITHEGREIVVNPANYAHLVEYGRRAVTITKKKILSNGAVIFGKTVKSVPARPFMRPAWDESQTKVAGAIKAAMKESVAEAKKGAKK